MSCDSKDHSKHMCALKAQGLEDCLRRFSYRPTVECRQCGARANHLKHVCAAHLLATAPNTEGGHGSVSLDEVGKPHAGSKNK